MPPCPSPCPSQQPEETLYFSLTTFRPLCWEIRFTENITEEIA